MNAAKPSMTIQQIQDLPEILAKSTKGPWTRIHNRIEAPTDPICELPRPFGGAAAKEACDADAVLITLAPQMAETILALVEELKRVRGKTEIEQ